MLTIKYRDLRGSESIQPDVTYASWHEGALTAQLASGGSMTFGPNHNFDSTALPVAYVVNENGSTVAKYEFHPQPMRGVSSDIPQAA